MKALVRIGLVMVIIPAALTSCWDKQADPVEPMAEACRPDFFKSLPAGKQGNSLIEKCMTQGLYRAAEVFPVRVR